MSTSNKTWLQILGGVFFFGVFLLTNSHAAGKPVRATGPYNESAAATVAGLRYYLGRDWIHVTVSQTLTTNTEPKPDYSAADTKVTWDRKINLELATLADRRASYILDLGSKGLQKTTLTMKIGENGLLSSINQESEGQGGIFISGIAKLVSTIFSPVGLLAFSPGAPTWPGSKAQCQPIAGLPVRLKQRMFQNNSGVFSLREVTLPQSILTRFFILFDVSLRGCDGWQKVETETDNLASVNEQLSQLRKELAIEESDSKKKLLLSQIDLAEVNKLEIEKQLNKELAAFRTAEKQFVAQWGLGKKEKKTSKDFWVPFDEIPEKLVNFEGQALNDLNGDDIWDEDLNITNVPMKSLLQEFGYVLVADDIFGSSSVGLAVPNEENESLCETAPSKRVDQIYYRQTVPVVLSTLVRKKNGKLGLDDQKLVQTVNLESRRCLKIDGSNFAKTGLEITFDKRGQPSMVKRSGGGGVALATQAFANAAIEARDTYIENLDKAAEIKEKKRTLALSGLADNLATLKAESDVLTADLELQKFTATSEQQLRQYQITTDTQLLAAELAKLKADLELINEPQAQQVALELRQLQSQLEIENARLDLVHKPGLTEKDLFLQGMQKDFALASFESTQELKLEIESLEQQVKLVQQQLALLQAQLSVLNFGKN